MDNAVHEEILRRARAMRRREITMEIARVLERAGELEARGVAKARIVVQEHASLTGDREAAALAGGQVLDATRKLLDVLTGQVAHLRRRMDAHAELEAAVPPPPVMRRLGDVLAGIDEALALIDADHGRPVPSGGWVPTRPAHLGGAR